MSSGLPFWDQAALDLMYLVLLIAGLVGAFWLLGRVK